MTTASRPRQSLLDLFDPLSSKEKVLQQSGEAERSSPTPSAESGSDKENICMSIPEGTLKTDITYDDKYTETLFFKRTTSCIQAPEHTDATRESFSMEPGMNASNLCLVELADELDKVCSLADDSVQKSVTLREPLTDIAIPQTNYQTPSSISRAHKNLISFDTPKYTPKSRSLSLKFAAGVSSCDGVSPKFTSPTTSSGKSTPRQNLLSPSIVITTPVDRNLLSTYKSTTPPLRPLFSSPTSEHKPSTPQLCDSSPRFHDPPSSLGRGVGNISSASLDLRTLGKQLDFSNDLLKDEPSLLDKLDNDSFSSDFDFPKTTIERIGAKSAIVLNDEDDASPRRSLSRVRLRSPSSQRARSKTPMSRSDTYREQLSDSSEDEAAPHLSRKLSSSSKSSSGASTSSRKGASSRRSSIYEYDGIDLLDEELDDRLVLRSASVSSSRSPRRSVSESVNADLLVEDLDAQLQRKSASVMSSRNRRNSLHKKDDSEDEERDDFDMKTYTVPKPVPIATSRVIARPRISSITGGESKPLARSQSLSRRTSMTMAPPPPASSLRNSVLGRPSLTRRSSIGINPDRQPKSGFDMSASQGRENNAPKLKTSSSITSATSKRLSVSMSVSTANAKEGAFGSTGRASLRTARAVPPSAFSSSTLGRSTASKTGMTVANSESRASNIAKSSTGPTLGRRSSIGVTNSLAASISGSTFRRTSSVPTLPPLSKLEASVTPKRSLPRAPSVGTERPKNVSSLSGLSSRLTTTAARAVRKLPTTSERRAL